MSNAARETIEQTFREKFGQLDHIEITLKQEFVPIIDAFLEHFKPLDAIPNKYSTILRFIDRISKGTVKSAIVRGTTSLLAMHITSDTYKATQTAMVSVLKWLETTNEQDSDKIGYIIDEYLRYWSFYYAEDYYFEDASALKQFEPDLEFRKYSK